MTQLFLVSVHAMITTDDCDVVPGAKFVVDTDSIKTLDLLDVGQRLVKLVEDSPTENPRPMTREEVAEWRKEQE